VKAKAKEAGMASPSAAPPEVLTDCEGNPLPDHKRLRAIFADAQIIKDAQAALTAFAKAKNILWASDSPAVESLKGQQQQIDSLHEQIRTKLRDYQFHAVCGECGGKGCAMCANMGAVTRMEWGASATSPKRGRGSREARKALQEIGVPGPTSSSRSSRWPPAPARRWCSVTPASTRWRVTCA
jgi:hypothetical protein